VVIVLFFALLVLYVVTHMNAAQLSELKATNRSQAKELKKLRKKQEEVRRKLLLQSMNKKKGTEGIRERMEDYGTIVMDRQNMKRIG